MIRYGWEIGRTGFTPVNNQPDKTINIGDLDLHVDRLVEQGKAKQVDGKIEIDLSQIGYTKLLGAGTLNHALRIIAKRSSEKAAEKISQAGGQLILPTADEPVKQG